MRLVWSWWLRRKGRLFLTTLLFFFFLSFISLSFHPQPSCTAPQDNFVYIKMIKCASETLASVFRRYAYERNLSLVLPHGDKLYLGWPYPIDEYSYRAAKTEHGFNILVDHAIYNEEAMDSLMQANNTYITSIREPYRQFKSMFNYYRVRINSNMSSNIPDPVSEYLHHLEKYEAVYKSPAVAKIRYCIPNGYSMSRNLMSFNLGFPTGAPDGSPDLSDDESYIDYFLTRLESKFRLVLIVDYFDESMVLLRRLMCWGMKDILYAKRNAGHYVTVPSSVDKAKNERENVEIYKKWSHVDYRLYDHFRKIFWKKVRNEGKGFYREVSYFKKVNSMVNKFCEALDKGEIERYNSIHVEGGGHSKGFTVNFAFCQMLRSSLLVEVKAYYDKLPIPLGFEEKRPRINFC